MPRQLHICRACGSPLVQVVGEPEQRGETLWRVELECPECWHIETGVHAQPECAALEAVLDAGEAALREGLVDLATDRRVLEREAFEHDAADFVAALEAGYVLPEDFR